MKITLLITAFALLVPATPALAAKDTSPPLVDGVTCSYTVPKKFGAAKALRKGIPVTVNCTGRAKLGAGATVWGRKVSDFIARRYSSGHPGDAVVAPPRSVPAGKTTIRMKVRPWAKRFFRKYSRFARFSIHTHMASLRTDGEYWAFSNKKTKIVR